MQNIIAPIACLGFGDDHIGQRRQKGSIEIRPNALAGPLIDGVDFLCDCRLKVLRQFAMALRQEKSAPSNGVHFLFRLGQYIPFGPVVAFASPIFDVDLFRFPKVFGGRSGIVDHRKLAEKMMHRLTDLEIELAPEPNMILKAGRQITEHRINFGWQCHQIGRISWRHALKAVIEIVEADIHVKRRADVKPDAQAVQLAHDEIF